MAGKSRPEDYWLKVFIWILASIIGLVAYGFSWLLVL